MESDCDCLMWRGRVFQTLGAETRKAREPNERLWRGTKSSWVEDERVDFVRFPAGALTGSLGQLSLPSVRVGKSTTSLLAGVKTGRVHLCRVASNTVIPYGDVIAYTPFPLPIMTLDILLELRILGKPKFQGPHAAPLTLRHNFRPMTREVSWVVTSFIRSMSSAEIFLFYTAIGRVQIWWCAAPRNDGWIIKYRHLPRYRSITRRMASFGEKITSAM